MFNKLLSNLPFNPSLIHQVAFYSKRLRKEASVRRIGFVFVSLTMVLQVFAAMAPAQAGNNCDPARNDIIHCGFSTKEQAVKHCRNNDQQFGTLLDYYKVSCDKLASAETQTTTINATDHNRNLMSVGRNAYGKAGEYAINVPNIAKPLYWRYMWSWGNISAKVLKTTTNDGQMIMVMYDCGNLVTLKDFNLDRPQPDAQLTLAKLNQPAGEVKPGDTIDYTLVYANKGGNAAFFSVNDTLPAQVDFVSSEQGSWKLETKGSQLKWHNNAPPFYAFGNTDAFGTPGFIKVKVKVKNNVASGTTICNKAWLQDVSTQTKQTRDWSETQVCNTVRITCPAGQVLNPSGTGCETVVVPKVTCTYLKIAKEDSRTKRTFETKVAAVNGATIKSYTYDFGDKKTEKKDSTTTTHTIQHEYAKEGVYTASVVVDTSLGQVSEGCKIQVIVKPADGKPLISIKKSAKNITQNLSDATTKKAAAGDVIEYTLSTTNYGDGDDKDKLLQSEDLADVLQYAQLDGNTLMGGIFDDKTNVLSWNQKVTIKAGQTVSKTFRVTIKNPIPEVNTPNSNPGSYDFVLSNTYGNTINIELPKSIVKITETVTTTTLPNTGPGESLAAGFVLTLIVGYFFARSRLLNQELEIVKAEYATSGGGI